MDTITPAARETRGGAQRIWLGVAIIVGIALYTILDIVLQLLPPHYDPITQAESDLGVGPYGWLMSLNFVLRGLVALAMIAGIRLTWPRPERLRLGLGLLALWAVGDVLLALFPTDIPPHPATLHGLIHFGVATLIFVAVAAGELILTRDAGRDIASVLLGIALAAACALMILLITPTLLPADFGLIERVFIGLALLWMLIVGLRLLRAP